MRNFLEKTSQILLYWIKTNTVRECTQIRQPWLDLQDIPKDKNRGDKMRFIAIPCHPSRFLRAIRAHSPYAYESFRPVWHGFLFRACLKPQFLIYLSSYFDKLN